MKKTQKNTSEHNRRNAWKYFEEHGYADHRGMVLHHKDASMKKNDPERYHQWNVEDLEPMTT